MRAGAHRNLLLAIIIASIFVLSSFTSAVQEVGSHNYLGELHPSNEEDILCELPNSENYMTTLYYYTSSSACDIASGTTFLNPSRHSNKYKVSSGSQSISEEVYPIVSLSGERSTSDYQNKDIAIEMELLPITEVDSSQDSILLHRAGICTEAMMMKFSNMASTPDSFWETRNPLIERASYFANNDPRLYTNFHIIRARGTTFYDDCSDLIDNRLTRFQGWARMDDTYTLYELPMYCEDIRLVVEKGARERSLGVSRYLWNSMVGEYTFSEHRTPFEDRYMIDLYAYDDSVSGHEGNYFQLELKYENNTLHEFAVAMIDGSPGAGGVLYSVYCDGPLDPHEDRELCEEGLDGVFAGPRSSPTGYGCCYESTELDVYPGSDDESDLERTRQCVDVRSANFVKTDVDQTDREALSCYNQEIDSNFCWAYTPVEYCGQGDRGQRLLGETGCSCHPDNEDNVDKPYRWNELDQSEGVHEYPHEPYFCELQGEGSGSETRIIRGSANSNQPFLYDVAEGDALGVWRECKEPEEGYAYGSYLCHEANTDAPRWHKSDCTEESSEDCGSWDKRDITNWFRVPELAWTSDQTAEGACSADKRIAGTCCHPGVFAVGEINHPNMEESIPAACISGTLIGVPHLSPHIPETPLSGQHKIPAELRRSS